jgi:hypothetical protein
LLIATWVALFTFMVVRGDYALRENDASQWLKTAEGLMLSASAVWEKLPEFSAVTKSLATWPQVLAYWPAFLLLTGYAFENLYRGALIACGKNWRDALVRKGGHGLANHIGSITTLNEDESNLVRRLETYLVWAGRYIVPKRAPDYDSDVQCFRVGLMSSDLTTSQRLFDRIAEGIRRHRAS